MFVCLQLTETSASLSDTQSRLVSVLAERDSESRRLHEELDNALQRAAATLTDLVQRTQEYEKVSAENEARAVLVVRLQTELSTTQSDVERIKGEVCLCVCVCVCFCVCVCRYCALSLLERFSGCSLSPC